MKTCEFCGADAVDARGICRNCGRQSREAMYSGDTDNMQSLGETRAADVPPGGYGTASATSQPARNPRMNPYPTEAHPASPVGGATSGGRFCGTCGARLESGMAFCGQCGTPVAASTANGLTLGSNALRQTGQEQYHVGGWSEGDGNELTEAILPGAGAPGFNNFGRSGVGGGLQYGAVPYHPAGYSSSQPNTAQRSANTTRLIIGVVCIIISIVSATAAIILAITMNP